MANVTSPSVTPSMHTTVIRAAPLLTPQLTLMHTQRNASACFWRKLRHARLQPVQCLFMKTCGQYNVKIVATATAKQWHLYEMRRCADSDYRVINGWQVCTAATTWGPEQAIKSMVCNSTHMLSWNIPVVSHPSSLIDATPTLIAETRNGGS